MQLFTRRERKTQQDISHSPHWYKLMSKIDTARSSANLRSRAGRSVQDPVSQAAVSGATAFRAGLSSTALNAFQFILIQLSFARQAPPCSLRTRSRFYPSESPDTGLELTLSKCFWTEYDWWLSWVLLVNNITPSSKQHKILEYVKDILQGTLHPGKQKQLKVFDKVKTLAMANLRVYC